jgi:hypothetical protein
VFCPEVVNGNFRRFEIEVFVEGGNFINEFPLYSMSMIIAVRLKTLSLFFPF